MLQQFSPHRKRTHGNGFSAMELLIAIALVGLIAAVLSPVFTATSRAWDKDKRLKEMVQQARDAMDIMVYELKKTNAVIDGTASDITTTAALDPRYVAFSTTGEEIYLDDNNSGYSTGSGGGTGSWAAGTSPGGFAGDYDTTTMTQGYATYTFSVIARGDYDIYGYYPATTGAPNPLMRFRLFDDGAQVYTTTYDQGGARFATTALGASWDGITDHLTPAFATYATALTLTPGGDDSIGVIRESGSVAGNVDAFKLVYAGTCHKVFFFDITNKKITYGDDDVSNNGCGGAKDAWGAPPNLANNPALLSNVTQINASTPIFSYYQANGVTAATSASNVSLIRVQFQIFDPEGKVPPYTLRAQAEVRSAVTGSASASQTKVVINEINYNPSAITYYSDDMEGNVTIGDGVTQNTYSGAYPWYSTYNNWYETFETAAATWVTGVVAGDVAAPWVWGTEADDIPAADFDPSSPNMWQSNNGLNTDYVSDTNERIISPAAGITFPATPGGTLFWRSYYVNYIRDADDVLTWEVDSTLQVTEGANAGADDKHFTPKQVTIDDTIVITRAAGNHTIGLRMDDDSDAKQNKGIYVENPVIYSTASNETMANVTATDIANGKRTLWARGKPDITKSSSAPARAHPVCNSGTKCWGTMSRYLAEASRETAQSYNYPEMMNASLVTPDGLGPPDDTGTHNFTIDLTNAGSPFLTFYQWMDAVTTNNAAQSDGGIVEICTFGSACYDDATVQWTTLADTGVDSLTPSYSSTAATLLGTNELPLGAIEGYGTDFGASGTGKFMKTTANLSNYKGNKVKIRWRFGSDALAGTNTGASKFEDGHAGGWYVDDISVTEGCTEEWLELYNPHPYPVKVTDDAATCRDPGPVCNAAETWRVVLHTHKATADTYDMITQYSGDTRFEIPAFGYAVVGKSSNLYTDSQCTAAYPVPSTAVRLLIDDGNFGNNGLPNEFGLVQIRDENDNLVDQVNYNVAMYDDFETASTASSWNTESTGTTTWTRGQLAGTDGMADNNDHTNNDVSQGYVFGTNMNADYANAALSAYLYDPVVDLTLATTTVTLSFWHEYKLKDADDTIRVQESTDGGSTWGTIGATISGLTTQTTWLQATRNPTNRSVTLLRFNLTTDADGNVDTGWYLDDVAVYWNWGGNGNKRTLQRVNWAASSDAKKNWCESQNNNGSPGAANNPAVCY